MNNIFLKTLKNIHGRELEENKVNDIMYNYIYAVQSILISPMIIKLSALNAEEIKNILKEGSSITLHKNPENKKSETFQPDKVLIFKFLYKFLYIGIHELHELENLDVKKFIKQLEDYMSKNDSIKNDTNNFNDIGLFDKNDNEKYVYIKRFINFLNEYFDSKSGEVLNLKQLMESYIINKGYYYLTLYYSIQKDLEDELNIKFRSELDKILNNKSKLNVLTYIKLRNDKYDNDNDTKNIYNKRFNIKIDKNKSKMIIDYDDQNNSLYNDNKETNVLERINTIKYNNKFILGPFTQIYMSNLKNVDIANQMPDVINALENNKPVFIIGYGASGAGKTTSLIYNNKSKEDGILVHLCNIMGKKGYKNIKVKTYEFYIENRGTSERTKGSNYNSKIVVTKSYPRDSKDPSITNGELEFENNGRNFVLKNKLTHVNNFVNRNKNNDTNNTTIFEKGTDLGLVIVHFIDNDRFVKATTNNPNSSRSHTLIFIKLSDGKNSEKTLIVGDFAGVENLFDCDDENVLTKFVNISKDNDVSKKFYSFDEEENLKVKPECKEAVKTNKDLYIFSPKTEVINENIVNATDKKVFFKIPYNYYQIQILLIKTLLKQNNIQFNSNDIETTKKFIDNNIDSSSVNQETITNLINQTNNLINIVDNQSGGAKEFKNVKNMKNVKNNKNNDITEINLDDTNYSNTNSSDSDTINTIDTLDYDSNISSENNTNLITLSKSEPQFTYPIDNMELSKKLLEFILMNMSNGKALLPYSKRVPDFNFKYLDKDAMKETSNKSQIKENKKFIEILNKYDMGDIILKTILNGGSPVKLGEFLLKENLKALRTKYEKYDSSIISSKNDIISNEKILNKNYDNFINGRKMQKLDYYTVDENTKGIFIVKSKSISYNDFCDNFKTFISSYSFIGFNNFENITNENLMKYVYNIVINAKNKMPYKSDELSLIVGPIINEFKDLLTDRNCRLEFVKEVCLIRREEGKMINGTLTEIRSVIKKILKEKNKTSLDISPEFIDSCLQNYCTMNECFSLFEKNEVQSLIFNIIENELKSTNNSLFDLVLSVFCVFNISKKANNPPPIPYTNISKIRYILQTNSIFELNQVELNKILKNELDILKLKLKNYKDKIPDLVNDKPGTIYSIFIRDTNDITNLSINKKESIENLLEAIDNLNATSAIGTLQFVDSLEKYTTTKLICTDDNINSLSKQIYKTSLQSWENSSDFGLFKDSNI